MRPKRNREVNIFSASVVDLFASGLGVFLIVAILALVNQKKEASKALEEKVLGEYISTEEQGKSESVAELEEQMDNLQAQLKEKKTEIYMLKKELLQIKEAKGGDQQDLGIKAIIASTKREYDAQIEYLQEKNFELQKKRIQQEKKISDLQRSLKTKTQFSKMGNEGVGINFNEFEIGTKIKLEHVHFYPGTENAIEPYASKEVGDLANFLASHERVTVEVSGHIFERMDSIEAGKAEDQYNLSGRRAEYVCNKLVEFGISRKRLKCLGYGATRSIYMTNDQYSKEAQMNRRVEIEILSK